MIPFVREMAFEYGVVDQVSPLIRRVVANNPGPFTYLGTGTYIVGAGEVAVIDPGPMMEDHLEALLAATTGERIGAILTTHTHVDHSPLAHPLQGRTVQPNGQPCGADARSGPNWTGTADAGQAEAGSTQAGPAKIGQTRACPGGAPIYGRAAPAAASGFEEADETAFRPDVEIADGALVKGPGWTLQAIATPGHASNHVCYALLEENALFSGDHVMGWSTTVVSPPDGDMGDYYASLEAVRKRDFATLWPTHGPPITAVAPFLDAYRAHRLARERQILEALAAGRSRIKGMVEVMYAAVDPRLHPAAAHSVLAHLIHLVRQGQVRCEGEPRIDGEFSLAA